MKLEVDKTVVDKTTKCPDDFACLTGKYELCPVHLAINSDALLIGSNEGKKCDYIISFGGQPVCTCPVRIEIYRKYGV